MTIDASTMYTIGQIARAVWPDGDAPDNIMDQLLIKPATGLGLAQRRHEWQNANQEDLCRLIAKLPSDLQDPEKMPVEDQGPFWMGYYHYMASLEARDKFGAAELAEIGRALWGEHWQQPMADALGLSDTARIRGWLTGKHVPAGVWADLDGLLRKRSMHINALSKAVQWSIGTVASGTAD